MPRRTLKPEDRALFVQVNHASLVNPFGQERLAIDAEIAGHVEVEPAHALPHAVRRVAERVSALEAQGAARPDDYPPEERDILALTLLFDTYYRHTADFDRLIEEQSRPDEEPGPVRFAPDVIQCLVNRGWDIEAATKTFALFYQLRRAFYFIIKTLVGGCPSMRALRERLWCSIFTHDLQRYADHLWNRMEDFSTLLLGETGTGKGTAAAAVGRSGFIPFDRARGVFVESFARSFVAINLSQYPETLIESELFGHRKGAFTGAIERHEGIFSRCSPHGSILLDEIGEVSVPVQIKLLQVLQERTFSQVGSHERHRFSGRVIAATNRSLQDLRQPGRLRDDFYYRLCSDVMVVPPLRRRIEEDAAELDLLLSSLVQRLIGEKAPDVARHVGETLRQSLPESYPWPGNVRELEQAVRRVLLVGLYEGETSRESLDVRERLHQSVDQGTIDALQLLRDYCLMLYERHGTYQDVARHTGLDRRTVRKYVLEARLHAGSKRTRTRV